MGWMAVPGMQAAPHETHLHLAGSAGTGPKSGVGVQTDWMAVPEMQAGM